MNHLQYAVLVGTMCVVAVGVVIVSCRYYVHRRDQSVKEAQIKYRINMDNNKKGLAVSQLERLLDDSLIDIAQRYKGVDALQRARRSVEKIYYAWLADHAHLFYVGEPPVRITSVRNGFFQYELPDHLKQFTKGKRK